MDQGTLFDLPAAKPRRAGSLAAEAAFRAKLKEIGAALLEPGWLGAQTPHRTRCSAGHLRLTRPADLRKNKGICTICAGKDPVAAEAWFRSKLTELGCTPLFDTYRGRNKPHPCLCREGHRCNPRPGQLRLGQGPCRVCTGLDPSTAKPAFYARMAELGAVVLGEYRNAFTKVQAICLAGHECWPTPQAVQQRRGICMKCSGLDPADAEHAFRAGVAELGGVVLGEYRNTDTPVHCRCKAGHDCFPRPHGVRSGEGICRLCVRDEWDAFYVVTSPAAVKFGVTTGDARIRLRRHAGDGYKDVRYLAVGLPGTTALDTENAVKSALALAGEKPVRGTEYFDLSCLALILDVATSWAVPAAA